MFGQSPPSVPDYRGAAEQQSAASQWLAQFQTAANRPNVSTPWGSMSWTRAGAGGTPAMGAAGMAGTGATPAARGEARPGVRGAVDRIMAQRTGSAPGGGGPYAEDPYAAGGGWQMNVELSPEQQAALEAQQRIGVQRSDIAEGLLGDVASQQGPLDFSGLPEVPGFKMAGDPTKAREQAYEATYGRMKSRLDPQWEQRQNQFEAQLRSQGLTPETNPDVWNQRMSEFTRGRNDAYTTAMESATQMGESAASGEFGRGLAASQAGFQQGLTSRQQALAEMLQKRGWSLNEVNALLSGQQVEPPSFPGFTQAGTGQAPNYMGAAQAGYQGQLDQYAIQQAMMQSLMSGGGNLAAAAFMSDERLKRDVHRLPVEVLPGVPLATWAWRNGPPGRFVGVIAQDLLRVRPDLVTTIDGFLAVKYGLLLEALHA